jgi:hypothetical protein
MDGGNGAVEPIEKRTWVDTTVPLYARVPGELKFLIHSWQSANRMRSFNEAMCRLLETHPALAQHAATLYNDKNEGKDDPV